jgi:hypothetical protein
MTRCMPSGVMSPIAASSLMLLESQNISMQELAWTIPAIVAFLAAMILLKRLVAARRALLYGIRLHPDLYRVGGPRWRFLTLMIWTVVAFGVGWLGFVAIGFVAMDTPPPIRPENQEAVDIFAWVLIGMEIAHATAMTLLWIALRSLAGQQVRIDIQERVVDEQSV